LFHYESKILSVLYVPQLVSTLAMKWFVVFCRHGAPVMT